MSTRSEKWPKKLDLEKLSREKVKSGREILIVKKVAPRKWKVHPLLIKRRPNQKSYRDLKKSNPLCTHSTPLHILKITNLTFITFTKTTQTPLLDQTPSQSPPVFKYPKSHLSNKATPPPSLQTHTPINHKKWFRLSSFLWFPWFWPTRLNPYLIRYIITTDNVVIDF